MRRIRFGLCSLFMSLAAANSGPAGAADALPALHADGARTSVSGLSSGAFMAVQYAVAFSGSVIGVASIAGGPYNCANTAFGNVQACMTGSPSGSLAWATTRQLEAAGQLDPLSGIARQKVYLFHGRKDSTVGLPSTAATRDFYRAAGVPTGRLAYVIDLSAGHAFIAPSASDDCGASRDPYIVHCLVHGKRYDQPREILKHIHGPLKAPASALSSTVRPFDQREFASAATSLDPLGFVYIPTACAASGAGCAVHVVFHGCLQGAQSVGPAVYGSVGFNRWADTNRLIVLYPQAMKSPVLPFNPKGCWDWWGSLFGAPYTGPTFMVRSGVQLSAVKAMVDRLTGH
ncbi:depolymerase [Variovorax humicola]|uniref:Depolymerase n=1 Tax=Variovorax humicola TaxID=1769758 RepID=A0ABU8W444_9BURK